MEESLSVKQGRNLIELISLQAGLIDLASACATLLDAGLTIIEHQQVMKSLVVLKAIYHRKLEQQDQKWLSYLEDRLADLWMGLNSTPTTESPDDLPSSTGKDG